MAREVGTAVHLDAQSSLWLDDSQSLAWQTKTANNQVERMTKILPEVLYWRVCDQGYQLIKHIKQNLFSQLFIKSQPKPSVLDNEFFHCSTKHAAPWVEVQLVSITEHICRVFHFLVLLISAQGFVVSVLESMQQLLDLDAAHSSSTRIVSALDSSRVSTTVSLRRQLY